MLGYHCISVLSSSLYRLLPYLAPVTTVGCGLLSPVLLQCGVDGRTDFRFNCISLGGSGSWGGSGLNQGRSQPAGRLGKLQPGPLTDIDSLSLFLATVSLGLATYYQ